MTIVIDVNFSEVCDAPTFALDLITEDRYYTVVADSHQSMIKWAYAFNLVRRKQSKKLIHQRTSVQSNERWIKYDFTFEEEGPLMLNVVGTSNIDKLGQVISNKIVVTSFEYNSDGSIGRAELSGKIQINDFVTGVNSKDLTCLTFDDAMNKIIDSSWPKTLHFIRDLTANTQSKRAADWMYVYYSQLTKRRKRYVEIYSDCISFFKPAPGGASSSSRDAYVMLEYIDSIRPIIDRTMPIELQHTLHITFKPSAVIEMINIDNDSTKANIESMTLSLSNERQFKTWRSVLASPVAIEGIQNSVTVLSLENIDAGKEISISAELSVKSIVTGKFSKRNFELSEGILKWSRSSKLTVKSAVKESKMPIANSSSCSVKSVIAFEDIFEKKLSGNIFQIEIQGNNGSSVIFGAQSSEVVLLWLKAITDVISLAPPDALNDLKISTTIEKDYQAAKIYLNDDEDVSSENKEQKEYSDSRITGVLFIKRDALPGFNALNKQKTFKKCYCVLDGFVLKTYESLNHPIPDLDIDMRSALQVGESRLPMAPENSIEIILEFKTYLFVAEDDEEQMKWLEVLSDCIEARQDAVTNANLQSTLTNEDIKYKGFIMYKSVSKITGIVTMKKRFFVIAKGYLSYYERDTDFYDNKEALNEISLMQISRIESGDFEKCTPGSGFLIHAKVLKGGDDSGDRIFELDAKSPFEAKTWMEEICNATNKLELRPKQIGIGYESFVKQINKQMNDKMRHGSIMIKANALIGQDGGSTNRRGSTNILFKRSSINQSSVLEEEQSEQSSEEIINSAAKPPPLILSVGKRSSLTNGGGRGRGRGNRSSITSMQLDPKAVVETVEDGDEEIIADYFKTNDNFVIEGEMPSL